MTGQLLLGDSGFGQRGGCRVDVGVARAEVDRSAGMRCFGRRGAGIIAQRRLESIAEARRLAKRRT